MKEKWWEEKIERMEQMVKEKQGELFEKILRKLSKETECKCKCKEIRSEEEIQTRRELEICREGIERERIIEEKNEEIEKLKKLVRYGIMRQEELTRSLTDQREKRRSRESKASEDGDNEERNEGAEEAQEELERRVEDLIKETRKREKDKKEEWKKEERDKLEKEKPKGLNEKEMEDEMEKRKRVRANLHIQYGVEKYRKWEEVMMHLEERLKMRIEKKRTTLIKRGQIRIECNSVREKKKIIWENRKIMKGTGIWIMDEKTRREREVEIWIRKVARWEQSNGKEVEIKEKRLKIGDIWRSWNETKGEMME
ncbi:LOW QUALITY PROTEIN: uncharacterized protein LOC141535629 [Cotesia typhae]|uniref:LOW QUALITY PROTEIN: uncharacterized protein LOC141535629 n=1 Tax=Cotesia typhae TaxID=2053667 RepID=UPI003D69A504